MSERRFFASGERVALYLAADGRCSECGGELEPGWHADHVKAHSRGGRTDVDNGQALCPECNLKKGATVAYRDSFNARPFQRDVIESILDGIASGRRVTTVLASPGSGKTLAYQAAATHLYREGLIDFVAIFVPRVALAQQCELKWMYLNGAKTVEADCKLFDAAARIGRIRHVKNQLPLTPPGETGIGIVTTYSALVMQPEIYRSWAQRHRGRFLLVADEAQFCGAANDERSGGTKAGVWMEELHEYSAHTLLLTGTPYRADDQPLILADYDQPGEDGLRQLLSHAEATYRTGIAEGYLRRFEAKMTQARVREKVVDGTGTAIEYDLSVNSSRLREVLRQPNVWQPIADEVVTAVREKQRVHPKYRGLISCMEQGEARQVFEYLARRHPGLRVMLSVSEDGKAAEDALRQFKAQEADVLVTVRKAFIGYDCPEITVVGVLTNYRDQGHLMQLVGRGLRTWSEVEARSQSCRVICPDDKGMDGFVKFMRDESEQGLRERDRRDAERERSVKPRQEPLSFVETAFATTARAVSNDVEMDNEQLLLIEAVKRHNDLTDDVTKLMKFADDLGLRLAAAVPALTVSDPVPAAGETPETEQEQIDRIKGQTAELIRKYLSSQGIYGGDPRYSDCMKTATIWVNKRSSLRGNQVRTLEQAMRRMEAAQALLDEAECLS